MVLDGRKIDEDELKNSSFVKPTIIECTPGNSLF